MRVSACAGLSKEPNCQWWGGGQRAKAETESPAAGASCLLPGALTQRVRWSAAYARAVTAAVERGYARLPRREEMLHLSPEEIDRRYACGLDRDDLDGCGGAAETGSNGERSAVQRDREELRDWFTRHGARSTRVVGAGISINRAKGPQARAARARQRVLAWLVQHRNRHGSLPSAREAARQIGACNKLVGEVMRAMQSSNSKAQMADQEHAEAQREA